MDCKDFEPLVFTYAELDAEEKRKLDGHLSNCVHCRELFQQVNEMQNRISLVTEQKPFPPNAANLTSKIITEINKPSEVSWLETFEKFLQNRFTKYSLSAIS